VRRLFTRLAVYFGITSSDPEYDAETRAVFVTTAEAARRGAVGGVIFAFVMFALNGFDSGLAEAVGGGTLFGLLMTVFWLFQRGDENPDGPEETDPR
jgi:uncharacterized membrane protein YdfJ with MMPL/SSD domain